MRVARVVVHLERHRRAGRNLSWLVFACAAIFVGSAVAAASSRHGICEGRFAPGYPLVNGVSRSIQPDDATPRTIAIAFGDSLAPRTQQLGFDVAYDPGDSVKAAS